MKKIMLAGVSALALVLSAGSASAFGGWDSGGTKAIGGSNAASKGGEITADSTFSSVDVISKNELNAQFSGSSINTAAAAPGGNGGPGACLGLVCGQGGSGGAAAAAAASLNNGNISQSGNAFQNFAGINTMTQSTAQYNNNQAASSVAAYAPVSFGAGSATSY